MAAVLATVGAEQEATCGADQRAHSVGRRKISVDVKDPHDRFTSRWFILYVPTYYRLSAPLPLWILAPGAFNVPDLQIRMAELEDYAEEQQFAFVALKAHDDLMNVFLKGRAHHGPNDADDVAYTRAVLEKVRGLLCIDDRRVFCTGYSRGARFCSRLASELSSEIAAIAPVSGLRFPEPSNATRPMPIITFHGTGDPVNPYAGGTDPRANHEYWDDPVEVAVSKWVNFNGCKDQETYRQSKNVEIHRHTNCRENADVVFVKIHDGGHTWPGSRFDWSKGLGVVNHEINASVMMGSFFKDHPFFIAQPSVVSGGGEGGDHIVSTAGAAAISLVLGMLIAALLPRVLQCCCPRDDADADSDGWSDKDS